MADRARVAATLLLVVSSASAGQRRMAAPRLLPLTREQVAGAGAAGVGCAWSAAGDRRIRFVAADEHAVVRLETGLARLGPARDAVDLFPFTFDRWVGGRVAVSVRVEGPAVRKGGDMLERPAVLTVGIGGLETKRLGLLNCGA